MTKTVVVPRGLLQRIIIISTTRTLGHTSYCARYQGQTARGTTNELMVERGRFRSLGVAVAIKRFRSSGPGSSPSAVFVKGGGGNMGFAKVKTEVDEARYSDKRKLISRTGRADARAERIYHGALTERGNSRYK